MTRNYAEQGETLSIKDLDKAKVLAALYNASMPVGMGALQYTPAPMTVERARAILDGRVAEGIPLVFDYLNGRVLKVNLSEDEFDTRLYDRDNGPGAAAKAIAYLMKR